MFVLRDIALIILVVEGIAITLLFLAVLGLINYGLFRFRWWHKLPYYFSIGRVYLSIGQHYVERACEIARSPVVAVATTTAGVTGGARRLAEVGREAVRRAPSGETKTEQRGDDV